jgi:hypothetical protein
MTIRVVSAKRQDSTEDCRADTKTFSAQEILSSIGKQFSVPRPEGCSWCGSALVYRQARLSIYESNESVTISVGFCEQCDGLPLASEPVQ